MTVIRGELLIRDLPRIRLFMWELTELLKRMTEEDNPEAENLYRIYSRLMADLTGDEP